MKSRYSKKTGYGYKATTTPEDFVIPPLPKPNAYAVAAVDRLAQLDRHIVINAVAGSGKTTLLRTVNEDARFKHLRKMFVAYSKAIQTYLEKLLPGCTTSTGHSLGYKMVRSWVQSRPIVEKDKYKTLIQQIMELEGYDFQELGYEDKDMAVKTLELVQVTLTNMDDEEAFLDLCSQYSLDAKVKDWVRAALEKGSTRQGCQIYGISFGDMIWLPCIHKMNPLDQYDLLLVDEAQDLSKALAAVILKHKSPNGIVFAVGDKNQAIFGFAGSNPNAYSDIIQHLDAIEMPLSVNYRCGKVHIEAVKHLVPQIEAHPGAIDGTIDNLTMEVATEAIQPGDMVLCRLNAPLMGLGFKLLKKGKPVKFANRSDLLDGLVALAKKVAPKEFPMLGANLLDWKVAEAERISTLYGRRRVGGMLDNLNDKVECMQILFENAIADGVRSHPAFKQWINDTFPDRTNAIVLSSIHRAKGLESNRVFLIKPECLPLPRVAQGGEGWEMEQERNLEYVAKTRAKSAFFYVS